MTDPVRQQNGPVPHWPDAQPTLVGDGMVLRPWADSDADDVYRACQDPAIQRFTTVPVPYLREHADVFVGPFQRKNWAERRGASFAVADASSGELLGACSLVGLDLDHLRSGAGYWTAPHARGRGVTARALRRLADWALLELGSTRWSWRSKKAIRRPSVSRSAPGFAQATSSRAGRNTAVLRASS